MASVLPLGGCTAAVPSVSTAALEGVVGGGLRLTGRGSSGFDQARIVTAADAPGGVTLRVAYPVGSAGRRAGREGGMQAYLRLPGRALLFLSTFSGGGDASWTSPVDQYAGFTLAGTAPATDGQRTSACSSDS